MRVAIQGVGIAGPTLAYWLAQYGHEPVLFEQAPSLRTGGYVIDFWGRGYDVAERMGLLHAIHQRAYQIDALRLVDDRGKPSGQLDLAAARRRVGGRLVSIARGDLAAALYDACAGIPSRFGVSISSLEQDARGVNVETSDGRRERFDAVVGADGLHSQVRDLAFPEHRHCEFPLGCHVAAFRVPTYPARSPGVYVTHTEPRRQVARVTLKDGATLVMMICRSELMPPAQANRSNAARVRQAFAGMSWEVPELLDALDQAEQLYLDGVSQVRLQRWSQGRVGLVGDAAACISLLGGEGSGLAMLEAYVLAGELHRAHTDPQQAFTLYHARLAAFLRDKQKAATRFVNFFAPASRWALTLRNAGIRLLSLPVLNQLTVASFLRDDLALPEYEPAASVAAQQRPQPEATASAPETGAR